MMFIEFLIKNQLKKLGTKSKTIEYINALVTGLRKILI